MNRIAFGFVFAQPTAALGQVVGEVDGGRYVGRVVVLGAVVDFPPLDLPTSRETARCRPRPRLLTPMLVAHAGLQLADAHSTLRGLAVGAVEANPSPIAQWAVRSPARAYGVSAAAAGLTWWGAGVIACHYRRAHVKRVRRGPQDHTAEAGTARSGGVRSREHRESEACGRGRGQPRWPRRRRRGPTGRGSQRAAGGPPDRPAPRPWLAFRGA